MAGKSTLNRLELAACGHEWLEGTRRSSPTSRRWTTFWWRCFMRRTRKSPFAIVLDIDATDFALHGTREQRFYHGYYRESCSLPVLMFVDRHPVLVRLRTAAKDAAFGIREELSGVIARIRVRWPTTRIIVRTDSGFCRDAIMTFIEHEENVDDVLGLARNARLATLSAQAMEEAMAETLETGRACRRFCTFRYRTQESWSAERRVMAKAEALPGQGDGQPCKENSRTIVTSLDRPGQAL